MKHFLILILISITINLMAQNDSCYYSGKILDASTRKWIPNVSLSILGTQKGFTSNKKGEFIIEHLCAKKNTILISHIGYKDTLIEQYSTQKEQAIILLYKQSQNLEEITVQTKQNKVTGTKTISQISINKAEIQRITTQSLAALVSEQQGIALISSGVNVQLPVIHGLYGNRILIVNNGLKHGFQNWGNDHAPEIDIKAASRITILKGASGVRFGPEALGGAIIIEPNSLSLNNPLLIKLGTGFETNGKGFNTKEDVGEGFKHWSYALNGSHTKIGDRHAPDYVLTNTGKEEQSFGFGTRYSRERFDFKLNYSFINQNLALLRSSFVESGNAFVNAINSDIPSIIKPFSYKINEPNQLVQHHLVKTQMNWWYSDISKLTFRIGSQLNTRKEFDVRRNADKPILDLELKTNDYQLEWSHKNTNKLNGLIGIQLFTQDNNNNPGTGTTPLIPNYNTMRYSVFMVENYKRNKNLFEFGLRLDYEINNVRGRETNQNLFRDEYSFSNLTSSLGFVRQISEQSTFRTNIGTAWRTPNMSELYSFGQHGFKTSFGLLRYYTNKDGELKTNKVSSFKDNDIQPEKGYKWINEWTVQKNTNKFTLTAYSHYIEDYIYNKPLAVIGTIRGPMPVFIFDQTDALFIGTDLTWSKEWSNQLSGTFGLSYLWSKNISKNEPLINQPPIVINTKLKWNTKSFSIFETSRISLKPSYTFKQFQTPKTIHPEDLINGSEQITPNSEIFDFKTAPKGYLLIDIGWDTKIKRFDIALAIRNVFNTNYRNYLNEMRYFSDETGRNLQITINYTLNPKSITK